MDTPVCRDLPHAHPGHGHTRLGLQTRRHSVHRHTDTGSTPAHSVCAVYDCAHEHTMISHSTGHSQRTRGCSPNPQCWWVQPGVPRAARGLAPPPPLRAPRVLSPANQQSLSRGHRGAHRQVQTHLLLQLPRGPVRGCERAPKLRERPPRGASPTPPRRETRVRTGLTQPGRAGGWGPSGAELTPLQLSCPMRRVAGDIPGLVARPGSAGCAPAAGEAQPRPALSRGSIHPPG